MSDFQKWSVLAFRALDDAGRVLITIEPESTTEGERLDQLKETIRELLTQVLLLNGVWTRRQLDERFQFGKLDTDALNVQLGQQQAEPVAPKCGAIIEVFDKDWRLEYLSLPVGKHKVYVQQYTYTTPPQRKPLTDEMRKQMKEASDSMEMRGAFANGWLSAEAAHHIQEPKL